MSRPNESPRAIPAQLNFLTLYNPSLGVTDETLKDQIVFYYSRHSHKGRSRHKSRSEDEGQSNTTRKLEEEENEKLRQIGLAQGMVDFAKNFSNAVNIDSIDTEKSRLVLHELEHGWWILASIDLTRLPTSKQNQEHSSPTIEYSAREVSPTQLLTTQLIQAHSIFLLHHAPKLSELYERTGRSVFCGLLERFWNGFVRDWDVLLHGNPATEIYNATKLAGGGELGVGVGEEEWGSGEREVLEGFMDRTEGLTDLIVGRYGQIPPEAKKQATEKSGRSDLLESVSPWLGTGEDAGAADGIVFAGKGTISGKTLRTISQWMESIFKHGDRSYGIGENPNSRPRQRRRGPRVGRKVSEEPGPSQTFSSGDESDAHPRYPSPRGRGIDLRRQAIENNAAPPGIPAPLVGKVERSLDEAVAKASQRASSQSSQQEKSESEALKSTPENESSVFGTENMMKYLTLGYGSSWTLNPKGIKSDKTPSTATPKQEERISAVQNSKANSSTLDTDEQRLQQIDPTPEVSDDDGKPFVQRLEQSIGKFLIGLSGDLEQAEMDTDNEGEDHSLPRQSNHDQRIFLRTVTVEMSKPSRSSTAPPMNRIASKDSVVSARSKGSIESTSGSLEEPKTSAAASIDGSRPTITHEKVQVAIYVHQPFIFVFLFELRTPSLTMPSFYRSIHSQLGPLQRPLLRSTDPARVAERLADAMNENSGVLSDDMQASNTIYDLVFDPARLIVRTSIPNIPVPGSLAAEGLSSGSSSITVSGSWYTLGIPIGSPQNAASPKSEKLFKTSWSRIEALNAHMQVLNSWQATRNTSEIEHTVKTNRGWWVLWLRVASRGEHGGYREAFLVRKAIESNKQGNTSSRAVSSGPGKWLLRDQPRELSGSSSNAGTTNAKGVSEGMGVDARKWVEALLHLTQ